VCGALVNARIRGDSPGERILAGVEVYKNSAFPDSVFVSAVLSIAKRDGLIPDSNGHLAN